MNTNNSSATPVTHQGWLHSWLFNIFSIAGILFGTLGAIMAHPVLQLPRPLLWVFAGIMLVSLLVIIHAGKSLYKCNLWMFTSFGLTCLVIALWR